MSMLWYSYFYNTEYWWWRFPWLNNQRGNQSIPAHNQCPLVALEESGDTNLVISVCILTTGRITQILWCRTYSKMTSFFRFVNKQAIYRLGIISLAHVPDFPINALPSYTHMWMWFRIIRECVTSMRGPKRDLANNKPKLKRGSTVTFLVQAGLVKIKARCWLDEITGTNC